MSPHVSLPRVHLDTLILGRPMQSVSSPLAQMYPPVVDQIPEERMDLNSDIFSANGSVRTSRGVLRRRMIATHYPSISSVQHTGFVDIPTSGYSMPESAPVNQSHQNSKSVLRARMSPEEEVDTDESPEVSAAAAVEDELDSPGSVVVLNRLGDMEKRQARIEVLLQQIVSKL